MSLLQNWESLKLASRQPIFCFFILMFPFCISFENVDWNELRITVGLVYPNTKIDFPLCISFGNVDLNEPRITAGLTYSNTERWWPAAQFSPLQS